MPIGIYNHKVRKTKEEIQLRQKEWNKANPERVHQYRRWGQLKFKYGITRLDYQVLYDTQSGRCAICKEQCNLLNVDHCHNTANIRGLLCSQCNKALGGFKDNIEILKAAIAYLERNQ